MSLIRPPEQPWYVRTTEEIEFEHDVDEEGIPINEGPWQNWGYSRSLLGPGVICEVVTEFISLVDNKTLEEIVLRPVKPHLRNMTARVFPWAVKRLSPLVMLAMQAESEGDGDGV